MPYNKHKYLLLNLLLFYFSSFCSYGQEDVIENDIKILRQAKVNENNDGMLILKRYDFYDTEREKDHSTNSIDASPEYDKAAFSRISEESTIDKIVSNVLSKKDAMDGITGLIERAYISNVDNTIDSCVMYVPGKYDSSKKYPLIVLLHGSGEKAFLPNSSPVHKIFLDMCEQYQIIMVAPNGRNHPDFSSKKFNFGASLYMNDGERDVLQVISLAEKDYNIDSSRVYLTGYSMGGFGTWYLGSRHPDIFAAIAPVCGFGTGKNSSRFKSPKVELESLQNMPVYVFHGEKDSRVKVSESREIVSELKNDGDKDVKYEELKGVDHNAWDYAYDDNRLFLWFLAHKKTILIFKAK